MKDASQITHDYKYQKYLKSKRSKHDEKYVSDQKFKNSISSNDLSNISDGECLILESRLNLQNNAGIDVDQMIKNHKNKAKEVKKTGCSTVLMILSIIFGSVSRTV